MASPSRHAPVSGLASLPPFLARSILLMAVSDYQQSKLTVQNVAHADHFRTLAGVSRAWKTLAADAASSVALSSLAVSVHSAPRRELLELRRQLTLQRAFLMVLDVHYIPNGGLINADQWAAALSCAPHIQELKLDSLRDERFS